MVQHWVQALICLIFLLWLVTPEIIRSNPMSQVHLRIFGYANGILLKRLIRPSFFNLLVYEKFFKKIESGGRNKNKNKTSKIAESKNKKKIKRLSPIFFFFFFFHSIFLIQAHCKVCFHVLNHCARSIKDECNVSLAGFSLRVLN